MLWLEESSRHLDHPFFIAEEISGFQASPQVLLSGHHKDIEAWRRRESLRATLGARPEMIRAARADGRLTVRDEKDLRELAQMGAAESESAA